MTAIEALCREIKMRSKSDIDPGKIAMARKTAEGIAFHWFGDQDHGRQAATEIEAAILAAARESDRLARDLLATLKVVEAARVFGKIALMHDHRPDAGDYIDMPDFALTATDVRKVRDALSALDKEIGNE